MATLERPRLRPLAGRRVDHLGKSFVAFEDSLGVFSGQVLVPLDLFVDVVRYFDGQATLVEIQRRIQGESGRFVSLADLAEVVEKLDRAAVLDGPTLADYARAYANETVRSPIHAGRSYPADLATLRRNLDRDREGPGGAGPARPTSGPPIRAVVSPHIDFGRGGPTYSHAYQALVEGSDAEVFVILGVAHQACRHRFALTRKNYATPFGLAMTDRAFVDRIAQRVGDHLFEDELAHRTEHSIEFQVVRLQHALEGRRDFTIVPILVGSFHDLMGPGQSPADDPEVRSMVKALRSLEKDFGKKVGFIGGVDLCHVGPEFGDPGPVADATLSEVRTFDQAMLERAVEGDAAGWFATAASVENRWRVCGLAATYTLLEVIAPARGQVLRYDQAVDPRRTCCVTFASLSFGAAPQSSDG